MSIEIKLPELPAPAAYGPELPGTITCTVRPRYFSVNQMQEYAEAAVRDAVASERTRVATLCHWRVYHFLNNDAATSFAGLVMTGSQS